MEKRYIFPVILIFLDIAAGIVFFILKDYKRGIYWFAAATLTTTVTF